MDTTFRRALEARGMDDTSRYLSHSKDTTGPSSFSINSRPGVPHPPANSHGAEVDMAQHPSGIVPVLQNVVATCSLECALDLKRIAQHARNAEYNPKRFAALIMRIREPKTTALIFSSGKMVCTGARSERDSRLASRKFAKIIMKLGYKVTFQEFKIQNIVGSCDVQFPIALERFNIKHNLFSRYEPELFPGLIYKMKAPKVVLLVFVSGKVVLTGAKTRDQIYQAFENIYPALTEFRKGKRKPVPEAPLDNLSQSIVYSATSLHNTTELHSTERKPESKRHLSPFLSTLSHSQVSIREESKSLLPSLSCEYESAALSEAFHSRFNPYAFQMTPSGDLAISQVQQPPPTPRVSIYTAATPQRDFIPPPTPQF